MRDNFDMYFKDFNELESNCTGLISAISVLKHQHNTDEEIKIMRDCIPHYLKKLDNLNVTFRFQNAMIYIAEHYDVRMYYMRTLLIKAVEHAGGYENIYRRTE
jgi:hypothetical protein